MQRFPESLNYYACDPILSPPPPAQKCRNKSRFRASCAIREGREEEGRRVILRVGTFCDPRAEGCFDLPSRTGREWDL